MIDLNQQTLQRGYPAPSDAFAARMDRLLRTLPTGKEQPMKRTLRVAIAAAFILAALSAAVLALTRPAILDWLLGADASASPQLENTAQVLHSEAGADGITVRLTSLVYDGTQLAFSYEVENADPARPALVLLNNALTLNSQPVGVPHYVSSTGDARLIPSPHLDVLPVRRNPLPGGGWSNRIDASLSGTVIGEANFCVYRPEKAFAILLPADSDLRHIEDVDSPAYRAELNDALATLHSYANAAILEADWEDAEALAAQGYTVLDHSGRTVFPVDDPRCHVVQTACITVPFAFDADNAFSCDFSGTTFALQDCTVQVEQFLLTPLVTRVHILLLPDENTEAAARALAGACGPFTLTDEAGQPVMYSEMDAMYSMFPVVAYRDGQWYVRYLEEMPGLQFFPSSIGFAVSTGELLRFDLPQPE